MKKILIFVLVAIVVFFAIKISISPKDIDKNKIYTYCKNNGYNTEYCCLVDFSIPQGLNRFFVYSFKENKIIKESLCAQGKGKNNNIFNKTFSNKIGSNYSSLGKYKIGKLRPMSSSYFKEGFTVYGLDTTNSNAYSRAILIHGGNAPFETFPLPCLPVSKGCFAVSNPMMEYLKELTKRVSKPLLLYAYK